MQFFRLIFHTENCRFRSGFLFIHFRRFPTLSMYIGVEVKPQKKLMYFALYISMFPQLIAGPIVRYVDIEEQLEHRFMNLTKFGQGAMYFMAGTCQKGNSCKYDRSGF